MGIADMLWMAGIIGGAIVLFYRSVWKKKGGCPGCSLGTCDGGKKKEQGERVLTQLGKLE